ncbi:hypothetical protein C5167_016199 [Papaver somniferum]|uniref:late embryogenesis abundant protein D-34-like n=1 Tax=Papaver somniferum TaxID=3469 RepID=UPI000E6FB009|nr:late embryogenesis abundant protein D-34-like [Papaver somniferum]RZC88396.1 hypothetical protein C5167_016199 [Papaver somniferum]
MSQQQPRRAQGNEQQQEPVKYGDVFPVSGELASKPIAPRDAAMMQSAESSILGQTQKGGPASVMQSAATQNVRAGVVDRSQVTAAAADQGVTVSETDLPGGRVVSEAVGGQVVGSFVQPGLAQGTTGKVAYGGKDIDIGGGGKITIGEALEATALTAGDKPVDQSDAAAIQAAEVRATGRNVITPGGVAAAAQAAATYNTRVARDEDKTTLGDVLTDAALKLPADKEATPRDAEGVVGAEMRNDPNLATHPGGVAASVVAAARLNQNND